MDRADRRPCFCDNCRGQIVARRTFYEHSKKCSFPEEVHENVPIVDPFDADVSSSEDDLDLTMPHVASCSVVCSEPQNGLPPLKISRLTDSEELLQVTICCI